MKLLLSLLLTFSALANTKYIDYDIDKDADLYYQIARVKITEHEVEKGVGAPIAKDLGQTIQVVKGLIALGKEVYKIIDAGRPVVNTDMNFGVSVIPFVKDNDHVDTFQDMENWSVPKAKSYKVEYENGFGMSVISFTYTVMYQYGGQYDGKGQYLTGVTVTASNVEVSWGFDFSATSSLVQVSNHGSSDNRVAGATFKVSYVAKSVFREIRSSDSFHVMGSGQLRKY